MTFENEVKEADNGIERGYLDLVVNSYRPLFERVKTRAVEHMALGGISEIDLGIHSFLIFRKDGKFYNRNGETVELRDLPKIYQEQSDYIAGCADSRNFSTPSVHMAMNSALSNFREKVKKSLADVL